MLHGFPNQVSSLVKVAKAIDVFRQAQQNDNNLSSDSDIGELLLRSRVIAYRDKKLSIDDYLSVQRTKKPSDRSYEASSRGIRELLLHLGFLEHTDGNYVVNEATPQDLFNASNEILTVANKENWKEVLSNMTLGAAGFHPYRILLKLIELRPGTNRKLSSLCLEATADTDEELSRICNLVQQAEDIFNTDSENRKLEEIIAELVNDTPSNINNAAKVLPSFAEQVGDIHIDSSHNLYLTSGEQSFSETPEAKVPATKSYKKASRKVSSDEIANAGLSDKSGDTDQLPSTEISAEELHETITLRKDRLKRHNLIVKEIANIYEQQGYSLYEDPYDCLAIKENEAFIFEVKSLNGEMNDEVSQVRGAFSQLKYYEEFSELHGATKVNLIAVFEKDISEQHKDWLSKNGITAIKIEELK